MSCRVISCRVMPSCVAFFLAVSCRVVLVPLLLSRPLTGSQSRTCCPRTPRVCPIPHRQQAGCGVSSRGEVVQQSVRMPKTCASSILCIVANSLLVGEKNRGSREARKLQRFVLLDATFSAHACSKGVIQANMSGYAKPEPIGKYLNYSSPSGLVGWLVGWLAGSWVG